MNLLVERVISEVATAIAGLEQPDNTQLPKERASLYAIVLKWAMRFELENLGVPISTICKAISIDIQKGITAGRKARVGLACMVLDKLSSVTVNPGQVDTASEISYRRRATITTICSNVLCTRIERPSVNRLRLIESLMRAELADDGPEFGDELRWFYENQTGLEAIKTIKSDTVTRPESKSEFKRLPDVLISKITDYIIEPYVDIPRLLIKAGCLQQIVDLPTEELNNNPLVASTALSCLALFVLKRPGLVDFQALKDFFAQLLAVDSMSVSLCESICDFMIDSVPHDLIDEMPKSVRKKFRLDENLAENFAKDIGNKIANIVLPFEIQELSERAQDMIRHNRTSYASVEQ